MTKNIMNKQLILFCFCCSLVLSSFSQMSRDYKYLMSSSSPVGNFIYLYGGKDLQDTVLLAATDHFVIKRVVLPDTSNATAMNSMDKFAKEVGTVRKPTTSKELRAVLPASRIKMMKEVYKLKSDQELVNFIQRHPNPISYFLFYAFLDTRMALGQIFCDKDTKQGMIYLYVVYRVTKDKKETLWGKTVSVGKLGNYRLSAFKAVNTFMDIKDSSVMMQWGIPLNVNMDAIPLPAKRYGFDKVGELYNTFFITNHLRASLEYSINDHWEKQEGQLIPRSNQIGDTLFFYFYKNALPGTIIRAKLTIEDEVYNVGRTTDTVNAFLVTNNTVPTITHLSAIDTLDGISLTWNQLPENHFLTGVQVIRYGDADIVDTLANLPITDTSYMDYAIKAGINYRYSVRVLYLPGMQAFQTFPAANITTLTKFALPIPPSHLVAKMEGKNIRLNWDAIKDPTIDRYYVYRGMTPEKMTLLQGSTTETTYLDTTQELSGASQYYYAVTCQNLMQKLSTKSNVVTIIPNRNIKMNPPTEVSFYYENGALNILWKDAREIDNHIQSFLVQKKIKEDTAFKLITAKPLEAITMVDTAIKQGVVYQYRVACVSFKGDTSNYSEVFNYNLPKNRVEILKEFNLANTDKGIKVEMPAVFIPTRKAYNIYRHQQGENKFVKIGTIPAKKLTFEDTKVVSGTVYLYAVSIVETDDREGEMCVPVEMRRM